MDQTVRTSDSVAREKAEGSPERAEGENHNNTEQRNTDKGSKLWDRTQRLGAMKLGRQQIEEESGGEVQRHMLEVQGQTERDAPKKVMST